MKKEEHKYLRQSMLYVPNGGIVVEIGSCTGGSAVQFAFGIRKWCPKTKFFCVDPFDEKYFLKTKGLRKKLIKNNLDASDVLKIFKKRMKPYPYTLIRKKSQEAVLGFDDGTVSLVFIDGNHTYEMVKMDIELWWPKLRDGGIMCGHDYGKFGVSQAVDEKFPDALKPVRTIWKTQKLV